MNAHPTPTPPRKRRALRRALLIGSIVIGVLVLLVGAFVAWAWWDHYSRFERTYPPPNAGRLEAYPQGRDPLAVLDFRRDSYQNDAGFDLISYRRGEDSLLFSVGAADEWNTYVRGGGWTTEGDLMCRTDGGAICVKAFNDVTLALISDKVDELPAAMEAFLAGKRGEQPVTDWYRVVPHNIDRLGPVGPVMDRLPERLPDSAWDVPLEAELVNDGEVVWEAAYVDSGFAVAHVIAHDGHALWGNMVAEGGTVLGDGFCREDGGYSLCFMAGSDGIIEIGSRRVSAERLMQMIEG